jgi:hypothetical protein
VTITVSITGDSGDELGRIDIDKMGQRLDGSASYTVRYAVDRVHAIGLHGRYIHDFNPFKHNVLGLLRAALMTLDESELEHEIGVEAVHLARGQHRALPTIPGEEDDKGGHH